MSLFLIHLSRKLGCTCTNWWIFNCRGVIQFLCSLKNTNRVAALVVFTTFCPASFCGGNKIPNRWNFLLPELHFTLLRMQMNKLISGWNVVQICNQMKLLLRQMIFPTLLDCDVHLDLFLLWLAFLSLNTDKKHSIREKEKLSNTYVGVEPLKYRFLWIPTSLSFCSMSLKRKRWNTYLMSESWIDAGDCANRTLSVPLLSSTHLIRPI